MIKAKTPFEKELDKNDKLRKLANTIRSEISSYINERSELKGFECEVTTDGKRKWEFVFRKKGYRPCMVSYTYNGTKSSCLIYFLDLLEGRNKLDAKKRGYQFGVPDFGVTPTMNKVRDFVTAICDAAFGFYDDCKDCKVNYKTNFSGVSKTMSNNFSLSESVNELETVFSPVEHPDLYKHYRKEYGTGVKTTYVWVIDKKTNEGKYVSKSYSERLSPKNWEITDYLKYGVGSNAMYSPGAPRY